MQWLSWNMYSVGICNDWVEIYIAFNYAMIELKYVYCVRICNDWVEICIGVGNMQWLQLKYVFALEYAMIELKLA